ncbi:hypothetical protein MMPV_004781 [Pyropia vietnamensis]
MGDNGTASKDPAVAAVRLGALDFDFPPVCAVTLGTRNVYACLVCGVFLAGRSPTSPAYEHALSAGHHPFVHLSALTYHALPDNTVLPAAHPTLARITANIRPTYTPTTLPDPATTVRPVDGSPPHPVGIVGLHPLRSSPTSPATSTTAYMGVVVHLLLAVTPVREALLLGTAAAPVAATPDASGGRGAAAVGEELGRLARKMGSPALLRGRLTPAALAAVVATASRGVYGSPTREAVAGAVGEATEGGVGGDRRAPPPPSPPTPAAFLSWLLHALASLRTTSPAVAKAVKRALRGKVLVADGAAAANGGTAAPSHPAGGDAATAAPPSPPARSALPVAKTAASSSSPSSAAAAAKEFWLLSAALPPRPLFPSPSDTSILPQTPLATLLARYTALQVPPPWLLITIRRGGGEGPTRNRTVVTFPVTGMVVGGSDKDNGGPLTPLYDLAAAVVYGEGGEGLAVHVRGGGGGTTANGGGGGGSDWWRLGGDGEVGRSEGGGVLGISEAHLLLYERRGEGGGMPRRGRKRSRPAGGGEAPPPPSPAAAGAG